MLTSLLAVAATLLMFQANTWYRVNGVGSGLNSTFKTRAKTTVAGASIAAAADLLLIILLGLHDEKYIDTRKEPAATTIGYRTGPIETTVPVSEARTFGAPATTATAV